MKFSIFGFDQQTLCTLNKEYELFVQKTNKTREKKDWIPLQQLDCADLLILQWIADFSSRNSVKKISINGTQYAWITYNLIIEDIPFLTINKRSFAERFNKLQSFGLINKIIEKQKGMGTFLYVNISSKYEELIYKQQNIERGDVGQPATGMSVEQQPVVGQATVKDYTTKQYSNYNKKEDTNVSSKKQKFDFFSALLEIGIDKSLATDWLIVRKNKRLSNTETALNRLKNNLEILKQTHNFTANDAIRIAVERSWGGVEVEYFKNIPPNISEQPNLFSDLNLKKEQKWE